MLNLKITIVIIFSSILLLASSAFDGVSDLEPDAQKKRKISETLELIIVTFSDLKKSKITIEDYFRDPEKSSELIRLQKEKEKTQPTLDRYFLPEKKGSR